MDEPGCSWPAWKFGMKRDDLFTKLHAQYNTFPSPIQDPEAFHHDVFEISHQASSADEFHRLMAARKDQRLEELNGSLELASLEIIANPSLIGTAQWHLALQLFRTGSLDSLVRYFSSYLPDDYQWRRPDRPSSFGDTESTTAIPCGTPSFFEDRPIVSHEPLPISSRIAAADLPPSPRSMTMCSDSSSDASPPDPEHDSYILNNLTPARTLSFSESESERFALKGPRSHLHEDDASQASDPETPVSSISDLSDIHHRKELLSIPGENHRGDDVGEDEDVDGGGEGVERREGKAVAVAEDLTGHDECSSSQLPCGTMGSAAPTPKPDARASCFFDARPSPLSSAGMRDRSLSPSRAYPLVHDDHPRRPWVRPSVDAFSRPYQDECDRPRRRRGGRRTPGEPSSRIQKPVQDPASSRPRTRRRAGC